jgi:hypothetical protein
MQYPFKRQILGCVTLLVETISSPANERLAEQQLIWLGGDEGDELGEGEAVLSVLQALE